MADPDFQAKAGDRLPAIISQLIAGDGTPVDLTDAAVQFRMRAADAIDIIVDAAGEAVDPPTSGVVRYWWDADDLAVPGVYLADWLVTFGDGRSQTFPPDGMLTIEVEPQLGDQASITPADLAWMREWVGSSPDDAALADRLEVYEGQRTLAVIGLLRMRRADLLSDPLSYSIRGDVTVNASANLTALDSMLAKLEAIAASEGVMESDASGSILGAQLERQDTWGRGYPEGVDTGWRTVTS